MKFLSEQMALVQRRNHSEEWTHTKYCLLYVPTRLSVINSKTSAQSILASVNFIYTSNVYDFKPKTHMLPSFMHLTQARFYALLSIF